MSTSKKKPKHLISRVRLQAGIPVVNKSVKKRSKYHPNSHFGECLLHLRRLKYHFYRIRKGYLKRIALESLKIKGDTTPEEFMVGKLCSRIDYLLYLIGYAVSVAAASQMVSHRKVSINGRRVNIRSIVLRPEDNVQVHATYDPEKLQDLSFVNLTESGFQYLRAPGLEEAGFKVDINFNKIYGALRS